MLLSVPILLIKLRWLVKVKVVNAEKVRVERNRSNPVKKDTEVVRPKIGVGIVTQIDNVEYYNTDNLLDRFKEFMESIKENNNELDNNNINNTRLDNK